MCLGAGREMTSEIPLKGLEKEDEANIPKTSEGFPVLRAFRVHAVRCAARCVGGLYTRRY